MFAKRLIAACDVIQPVLRDKCVCAKPKMLGVALGYILLSGYKTFRALCRVCDLSEPWGQQGLVLSRMLFENYVTARWLAARPSERAKLFIEFEHVAEVQSALIKGEIDEGFLTEGGTVPAGKSELHRQFFRVLPSFCKLKPKHRLTKEKVLKLRWTATSLPTMIRELDEPGLVEDYQVLHCFSSSVVHTTAFGARANIADDLTYRWTPDPELAVAATGYGLGYFLMLALICNERLHLDQELVLEALERETRACSANERT